MTNPSGTDPVAYLKSLEKFGSKPGLERVTQLLGALGNPQDCYQTVHVAGSNGKGTTCAMLHSILVESGIAAALFSKPHLQDYRERMRIRRELITHAELTEQTQRVRALTSHLVFLDGGPPTEFETSVAIAFEYFRVGGASLAVVETGMGGSWDATNVLMPELSVITPIGLDHMDRLGSTLEDIASEKAGILKKGRPVVVVAPPHQEYPVMSIIERVAGQLGCPMVKVGLDWTWHSEGWDWEGQTVDIVGPEGFSLEGCRVPLLGAHQLVNAATAVAAAAVLASEGYPVTPATMAEGLAKTVWPGRLELVSKKPHIFLDGTTNPHGAKALGKALVDIAKRAGGLLHLVVGISKDKDVEQMLGPLAAAVTAVADAVDAADAADAVDAADTADAERTRTRTRPPMIIATQASSSRLGATSAETIGEVVRELWPWIEVECAVDARTAVERSLAKAESSDVVCVCGSLYLVGEVRSMWRNV